MKFIRITFLAGFLFTALYHMLGTSWPSLVEPASFERHVVFVVINLLGAFLLYWNRPKPLLLLLPLIIQQLWSHGDYGWHVWQEQHRIDWASVMVIIGMPLLGFYIWKRLTGNFSQ